MNKEETSKLLANSEHVYVQSNDFVSAHYKENMTFWEFVLIAKMCSMIHPKDVDFKGYRIYLSDLLKFMNLPDSGNVYGYILEAAERLLEKRIVIHTQNDEGQAVDIDTHIVTGVERLSKPTRHTPLYITLTFMPQLRPYLLQLKDNFTKFDFRQYKLLRTGSSIRIYHILKQYWGRKQRHIEIELDELKAMLGVGDKYDLFGHFKSRILEDARQRLTETTDIRFEYDAIRIGKKVEAIKFHLFENTPTHLQVVPQKGNAPQSDKSEEVIKVSKTVVATHNPLEKILAEEFGVNPKVQLKLFAENKSEDLERAIKITRKAIQTGRIKDNKAGFFVKAVQEHYTDAEEVAEKKQTLLKQRAQEQQQKVAEQKTSIDARKKENFKREELKMLQLVALDETLATQAIEHIVHHRLSSAYDAGKSLSENLQNPSFKAVFLLTIKKMRPQEFIS